MKMQFELLILIITLSLTIANVINLPEYTQSYVQDQPIERQFYFIPNQYQISDYFYTQPKYIPFYLNEHQINNPQDSDPLLGSLQDSQNVGLSRRVVKIGGRKVIPPTYIYNKRTEIPPSRNSVKCVYKVSPFREEVYVYSIQTIHQRFKKSVGNQPDSRKTGESDTVQPNSSVNDQTTSKDNEIQHPNSIVIKDKENQARETKKDLTTTGTLFDLNPQNLNPAHLIPPNNQEIHNPTNLQDSNLVNAIVDRVKEISKSENLTKEMTFTDFLEPKHSTTKSMESNVLKQQRSKDDEIDDPITGSVQMKSSNLLVKPLAQQIYPTWPLIYNYYKDPLGKNLVYSAGRYQPGVYTVYYNTDGTNKILIPKTNNNQQWSQQQQQICQNGINQIIDVIPNSGYTYWPSSEYNYLSNYMLQYPKLFHYYPVSVYPSSYAPYVQNELL